MKFTVSLADDKELREAIMDIVRGITRSEIRAIVGEQAKLELASLLKEKSMEKRVESQISEKISRNFPYDWAAKDSVAIREKVKKELLDNCLEKVKAKIGEIKI